MAKKKKLFQLNEYVTRVILLLIGSAISVALLTFATFTLIAVSKGNYTDAPQYLIWVFVFLAISRLFSLFKLRTKANLIRCLTLLVFDIALGIITLLAKNNLVVFSISAGLFFVSVIVSRVFIIIQKRTLRKIVFNSLLIVFSAVMAIGLFASHDEELVNAVVLIECLVIVVTAFIEVTSLAFGQIKLKVLVKIVIRTYAIEVLLGLATLMVSFSLLLTQFEEGINNFPDALWYCFAVVTTIGFGDFVATSLVGRILTVILGMYGIIVVAIITSIIVNFYNETSGKNDSKDFQQIEKEENDKKPKK